MITVLMAAILFFSLRGAVQNFRVVGSSMQPYIMDGQYLLTNKLVYTHFSADGPLGWLPFGVTTDDGLIFPFHPPNRGDLVVFHSQFCPTGGTGDQCIKRIVALPGETVEIKRGQIYIDGVFLQEPYIENSGARSSQGTTLGKQDYYLLGDNRTGSYDSRDFGPVDLDDLIGKAWVTYWPLSAASVLQASPPPSLQPSPSGLQ
ncbi:MAG: signal peptidase I [Chloroflexi bacterium]|nr:MAG: signal peptidase I [Chloroflexota bacterium]